MSVSILSKLWNSPPKKVVRAVVNKLFQKNSSEAPPTPTWNTITGGPLNGSQLFLFVGENEHWRKMLCGQYDEFLYNALKPYGDLTGKTFWDIGAHFGYHTLGFSSLVGPTGHIVAFEPNPYNRERLQLHLSKNPTLAKQVSVDVRALSDSNGETTFNLCSNVDFGSTAGGYIDSVAPPLGKESYRSFHRKSVTTIKIDTLLGLPDVLPPDFLKIDVEGAELLVLKGATELLTKIRPVIFMEVHSILMMHYTQKLLLELNYQIEVLDEQAPSTATCFIVAKPR